MDINSLDRTIIGEVWTSPDIYSNLETLCSFGSRFAGTESEREARDFLLSRMQDYGLESAHLDEFGYTGWWRGECTMRIVAPVERALPSAISLVYSPSTPPGGLRGRVINVGMGTRKEFEEKGEAIRDKIVMVTSASPEYQRPIHRREKFGRAVAGGARGFIFVNHLPGILAPTGSLRPGRLAEIPGVGLCHEEGFLLGRLGEKGPVEVEMHLQNRSGPAVGHHVVGEIPGQTDELVIVGAHYDGHDISQGARDNASGTCLVLELARVFAPLRGRLRRTIRLICFAAEELGVLGSTEYVKAHQGEMDRVALMLNLDGGVGPNRLLLLNGFDDLRPVLHSFLEEMGYPLRLLPYVVTASDNFPFFLQGVPALCLSSPPADPGQGRGFGHTAADTLDKVSEIELRESAMVAARLVLRAASHEGPLARRRSRDELRDILIAQGLEEPLKAQEKWPF